MTPDLRKASEGQPYRDLQGRKLDGGEWKGLAQPSQSSPAGWFCEPGRHSKGMDAQENVWSCWRCGARGYHVVPK